MVLPAIVFKSVSERMSCFWRARWPPILHLDIKGHMKGKDPSLSTFNSLVYYCCLCWNPEGIWHSTEKKRWHCFFYLTSTVPEAEYVSERLVAYLNHCDHAIIGDRVSADGEVSRGVSADDPVDGVPVRRVWLVSIYHREIRHYHVHSVLWHLTGKLQK